MDASIWKVRSENYMTSHEKIQSSPCLCHMLCVDLFRSNKRIDHIALYLESALQRLKEVDFSTVECVMIINLQISGFISVVSYFVVPKSQEEGASKLLHRFLNETDQWRNERFKLLPHIVEGSYLIKKMVGMTPCLIGKKGESHYYRVEVDPKCLF